MIKIIEQIFLEHGFTTKGLEDNSTLAMIEEKEYFFVSDYSAEEIKNFFDCHKTNTLIEKYDQLKIDYPDLKKNSSLIICHNTKDIGAFINEYKGSIIRIEEDEYYFRKYIVVYSDKSMESFKTDNTLLKRINEILQSPEGLEAYQQNYYKDDVFFIAMQLMVKLPFLIFNPMKSKFLTMEQELINIISNKGLDKFNEHYKIFDCSISSDEANEYFVNIETSMLSTDADDDRVSSLFERFEVTTI